MAYLMVKYQEPTTYALVDLSYDEFAIINHALRELQSVYEKLEAPADELKKFERLVEMLERRYDDD